MIFGMMLNKMKDKSFTLPITNSAIIKELIPHREPVLLVDGLIHFEPQKAKATLTVLETNIFVENQKLSETGLLEHMAQTAALYTGYKFRSQNKPIKEGMIAAIKSASILNVPQINDTIISEVFITYEAEMLTQVSVTTSLNDTIIATATMSTVLKN